MTPAQIAQGNKLATDEIRKAADQGDADAQFNLGFAYYMGRAYRRTTQWRRNGFRKLPIKATPALNTILASCMRRAAAWW